VKTETNLNLLQPLREERSLFTLTEGILDVPGGKASGIHLSGEFFQDISMFSEELPKLGGKGLHGISYLRELDSYLPFSCFKLAGFIAISVSFLLVFPLTYKNNRSLPVFTGILGHNNLGHNRISQL